MNYVIDLVLEVENIHIIWIWIIIKNYKMCLNQVNIVVTAIYKIVNQVILQKIFVNNKNSH